MKVTIQKTCKLGPKTWKAGDVVTVTKEFAAELKTAGYLDKPTKKEPQKTEK